MNQIEKEVPSKEFPDLSAMQNGYIKSDIKNKAISSTVR